MNETSQQFIPTAPPGNALPILVYSSKEAEAILRLSKNTINALLNSGKLRAVRSGRKWLIPHAAILEFLGQEGTL